MSAVALLGTELFKIVKSNGALSTEKITDLPSDVTSLACGTGGAYYFLRASSPSELFHGSVTSASGVKSIPVPHDLFKVVVHHGKVFCGSTTRHTMVCYDPLCKVTELIDIHHQMTNFEAADHGFVIESDASLLAYHFTNGVTKVPGAENAVLTGHYKRKAIAIFADSYGQRKVRAVSESGSVMPFESPANASSFVAFGEDVLAYDEETKSLILFGSGSAPTTLPVPSVPLLAAVPAAGDDGDDVVCTLCFCEFEDDDGVTLDCGHMFHLDCVGQWAGRWDEFCGKGTHVVFTNGVCPGGCKHLMRHPSIPQSRKICELNQKVLRLAKEELRFYGPEKVSDDILYYICNTCKEPFFGGDRVCSRMQSSEPTKNPAELLCESCSTDFRCPAHGRSAVVYKCRYCCNPATQRSFGNRYMCDRCDARWTAAPEPDDMPCCGASECPLGGSHPEGCHPIGCYLCLPENTIQVDKIQPAPTGPE